MCIPFPTFNMPKLTFQTDVAARVSPESSRQQRITIPTPVLLPVFLLMLLENTFIYRQKFTPPALQLGMSHQVSLQVAGCAEGSSALAAPERLLPRLNSQVELQVAVAGCGTATLFKRVCLDGWLVLLPDRGRALPT